MSDMLRFSIIYLWNWDDGVTESNLWSGPVFYITAVCVGRRQTEAIITGHGSGPVHLWRLPATSGAICVELWVNRVENVNKILKKIGKAVLYCKYQTEKIHFSWRAQLNQDFCKNIPSYNHVLLARTFLQSEYTGTPILKFSQHLVQCSNHRDDFKVEPISDSSTYHTQSQ